MPTQTKRPQLNLTAEEKGYLEKLSRSLTAHKREVDRAKVLLMFSNGNTIKSISDKVGLCRPSVYACIDKSLSMGIEAGLKDLHHSPNNGTITNDAKVYVVNLACTKPKEHGYAAELWTLQSLASHIQKVAETQGFSCLSKVVKSTIHKILQDNKLKPHKVKYYLEKRDPDFEVKMQEVLMVYKEVELQNSASNSQKSCTITLSVDEKPGVQALANTAPDLPPVAGQHATMARDHEYVRLGTASILAGIDLHDGHVFAQVHHRHRSREFIELLKEIDAYYDPQVRIRIILDNHSAHISKETMAYLRTRPNRFEFIHTPKHGSWLNIVETLFGKMARTFLKSIRVASWEELRVRILKGVQEINLSPVVHRWTKFDALDLMWSTNKM